MKVVNPDISQYPSVEKISTSYDTMKAGVSELAEQVTSEAGSAAQRISTRTSEFLMAKLDDLRSSLSSDFGKIKSYVQEEPAKGLAMAFVTGAIVSLLMRRS